MILENMDFGFLDSAAISEVTVEKGRNQGCMSQSNREYSCHFNWHSSKELKKNLLKKHWR